MMFNIKISLDQITYGPKTEHVDPLVAITYARQLEKDGYRKTSHAYCRVNRIDRDDWLDLLALRLNCCRADFYKLDGSGIDNSWRDHYVRCFSEDGHTVHPAILKFVTGYR